MADNDGKSYPPSDDEIERYGASVFGTEGERALTDAERREAERQMRNIRKVELLTMLRDRIARSPTHLVSMNPTDTMLLILITIMRSDAEFEDGV